MVSVLQTNTVGRRVCTSPVAATLRSPAHTARPVFHSYAHELLLSPTHILHYRHASGSVHDLVSRRTRIVRGNASRGIAQSVDVFEPERKCRRSCAPRTILFASRVIFSSCSASKPPRHSGPFDAPMPAPPRALELLSAQARPL